MRFENRLRSRAPWVALCGALLFSACSNDPKHSSTDGLAEGGGGSSVPMGDVSCTDDPRVDGYAAGLTKAGELGQLEFRLVESDPGPPEKGSNSFRLELVDGSGALVEADLQVNLKMPDHGHGTSVVPKITYDAAAQAYVVSPLYLFMAGVWRIDFEASSADVSDRASFFFCVEG